MRLSCPHPTSSKIIHNCFQVTSDFHMPRATYIFQASAVSRNWETGFWDGSHRPARLGLGFAAEFRQGIPTSFAFFAASLPSLQLSSHFWSTSFSPPVAPGGPRRCSTISTGPLRSISRMTLCGRIRWSDSAAKNTGDSQASDVVIREVVIGNTLYILCVCIYIWYDIYIYIYVWL